MNAENSLTISFHCSKMLKVMLAENLNVVLVSIHKHKVISLQYSEGVLILHCEARFLSYPACIKWLML